MINPRINQSCLLFSKSAYPQNQRIPKPSSYIRTFHLSMPPTSRHFNYFQRALAPVCTHACSLLIYTSLYLQFSLLLALLLAPRGKWAAQCRREARIARTGEEKMAETLCAVLCRARCVCRGNSGSHFLTAPFLRIPGPPFLVHSRVPFCASCCSFFFFSLVLSARVMALRLCMCGGWLSLRCAAQFCSCLFGLWMEFLFSFWFWGCWVLRCDTGCFGRIWNRFFIIFGWRLVNLVESSDRIFTENF